MFLIKKSFGQAITSYIKTNTMRAVDLQQGGHIINRQYVCVCVCEQSFHLGFARSLT